MLAIVFVCVLQIAFAVTPHPWDAVARADAHWQKRHKNFIETTQQFGKDIKVVFYGDSLTQRWENQGRVVWHEYYGNLSAVNYGIDGDRTEHLVYRMHSGELNGLHPFVAVLNIGTNNMRFNTVKDIAKGVKQVVDSLHAGLPNIKVLLLGILARTGPINSKVNQTNQLIAKFDNGKSVRFLNMNSHFENDTGMINYDLYDNGIDLNVKGYRMWAKTMHPLLKTMLNSE